MASLPHNKRRSRKPKVDNFDKILSKLIKALKRNYPTMAHPNSVYNLIDYFAVPKAQDVRLVLNGSSCGLNKSVWAPNFWLLTSISMTRVLGYNYKVVGIDLGEMFLNFLLDPKLSYYSGMDLTPFKAEISKELPSLRFPDDTRLFAINTKTWMGFRPNPEWACRFYYLAEEFVRGDERHLDNPLRWDSVILNLVGNKNYNPALPNVIKWKKNVRRIAGDIKAYVDDLRPVGWSMEHAWSIARHIASRLQFLGIQDAPRKRRVDNGPWTGSIYIASEASIQKTVTVEKWQKARNYILELNKLLKEDPNRNLDYKMLEKIRGFFCHLAITYDLIFPYLKGFYLTLCSHLPKRDGNGWKMSDLEWIGYLEEAKDRGRISKQEVVDFLNFKYDPKIAPLSVKPVSIFHSCLKALTMFFTPKSPPAITERSTNIQFLIYGFADASKAGLGSSIAYSNGVQYRIGTWGPDEDHESSNFREFSNLVEAVEFEVKQGRIYEATLIMATDNTTVEAAIYKGNSTNTKLLDLIVRFKCCELKSRSKFIITHVSGERMKSQGTDGISRGQMREGVSIGADMLRFCPWGQSALERSPNLLPWIKSWLGSALENLELKQWFTRGHDHLDGYWDKRGFFRLKIKSGTFLWHPPPAAADAALEEIRKARLKRRNSSHIFIIPRLILSNTRYCVSPLFCSICIIFWCIYSILFCLIHHNIIYFHNIV